MVTITDIEVYSDTGRYIHRLGTDSYFRRSTVLPTDTVADFEEVDAIPDTESAADYDALVESLIRQRYSVSQELALLRQRDTKPAEFAAYNAYAEQCKAQAREEMGLPAPEAAQLFAPDQALEGS